MNGAAAVPFDSMGNDEKFKNKLVGSWMCVVWCACMRLYLLESSKMSLFDRKPYLIDLPMDTIRCCRPTRNGLSLAPTDVIDNLLLKFNYCSMAAGLMYAFSIYIHTYNRPARIHAPEQNIHTQNMHIEYETEYDYAIVNDSECRSQLWPQKDTTNADGKCLCVCVCRFRRWILIN